MASQIHSPQGDTGGTETLVHQISVNPCFPCGEELVGYQSLSDLSDSFLSLVRLRFL